MKPGAQNNNTIQLATGNVSFPVRLFSLAGRNGLDFDLAIVYNSGGLHKVVDTSNLDAPTGLLGLGWSLPKEAIIRNTSGTATSPLDDVYYLSAGGNLYQLFKISSNADGDCYECENYNFWKIRYLRSRELWMVTKENGDRYSYGGELPTSAERLRSSLGNSIEWAVKWKNWTGPSNVAVGQEQFPIVWNLASIENIWNERVSLEYQQTQCLIGTLESPLRRPFSKSCRLSRITGACGETIVLKYKDKQSQEYHRSDSPPTAAKICQLVGKLSTCGWETGQYVPIEPVLRLALTVTGKNGFSQNFTTSDRTADLSFSVNLDPNAPETLDVAFKAEAVNYIGEKDEFLSGSFKDVVANAGICQRDYRLKKTLGALKLSYVSEQVAATNEADIFQHRQEAQYLASLELYSAGGTKTEQIDLRYRFLGSDVMQKRVLGGITRTICARMLRKDSSYQLPNPKARINHAARRSRTWS